MAEVRRAPAAVHEPSTPSALSERGLSGCTGPSTWILVHAHPASSPSCAVPWSCASDSGLLRRRAGIVPLDFYRDTGGPIGRTVMDVAKVMNVLPGVDPLDTVTDIITQQNVSTTTDYTAMLTPGALQVCPRSHLACFRRLSGQRLHDRVPAIHCADHAWMHAFLPPSSSYTTWDDVQGPIWGRLGAAECEPLAVHDRTAGLELSPTPQRP